MTAYPIILFGRFLEIGSRFIFLAICLRSLSLIEYGELSYSIALLQFFASVLFASSLPAMAKIKPQKLLSTLTIISLIGFAILYLIFGYASLIFLFYSFLYILNGWYGNQARQQVFGAIRGFAFLGQLLFLSYGLDKVDSTDIYLSYMIPAFFMIVQLPFRQLSFEFISKDEFVKFAKIQIQSLSYQSTKIVERWVAQLLLNDLHFGLYSTFRDILNAVNLTVFNPVYQTKFKSLVEGVDYRKVLKPWKIFWGVGILAGVLIVFLFPNAINHILNSAGIKLASSDLYPLGILFGVDFFRSFYYMVLESKYQLRKLFKVNITDNAIQICCCLIFFLQVTDYQKMLFLFFSRAFLVTIIVIWINERHEPTHS